jgi:1-acyl-sn-glycerol-3-phosphate acyltransferase
VAKKSYTKIREKNYKFNYPTISKIHRVIGKRFYKVTGWRVEGQMPNIPKCVVILAPHTSGWDLAFGLGLSYIEGVKLSWMGKKEIFRWPLKGLLRWLGGINIDRDRRASVVEQVVQEFEKSIRLVVAMAPEGTRSNAVYWKTGFYFIAKGAEVPIVLAFLDYKSKVSGFGPTIMPSGDIHADMEKIASFYKNVNAKYPQAVGEIAVRPQ